MKDYMISMFIDDELDFDEKIELVQTVHANAAVKNEIVSLLHNEKRLRSPVVNRSPVVEAPSQPKRNFFYLAHCSRFRVRTGSSSDYFVFCTAATQNHIRPLPVCHL